MFFKLYLNEVLVCVSLPYDFIKLCFIDLYNGSRSLGKRAIENKPINHIKKRELQFIITH